MQSSSGSDEKGAQDLQFQQQGSTGASNQHESENKQRQRMAEQQEMMKNSILTQILDKSALARLSNLSVAKPDKGKAVENLIVQMARSGQIRGKMSDDDLRNLLDRMAGTTKTTKVKYDRRRAAIDSDDEEAKGGKKEDSASDDSD